MTKNEIEKIKEFLDTLLDKKSNLQFEPHNFKINSKSWKKITVNGEEYKVNSKKDVWEILEGYGKGEQLFTYIAAIRETQKAGKRMPTDEEFTELLKTKEDMPNLVFYGYRDTDGSFYGRTTYALLWSSTESGTGAWIRNLNSGYSTVYRHTDDKAYGFSVRCIKN